MERCGEWVGGGAEARLCRDPSMQQVCARHLADVITILTPSLGWEPLSYFTGSAPWNGLPRAPSQEWSPPIDPCLLDSIPLSVVPTLHHWGKELCIGTFIPHVSPP